MSGKVSWWTCGVYSQTSDSSQTSYIMPTLYCVQGKSDKSLRVRRLHSQEKIQTEIKIQTKENFWRKGFGLWPRV